MTLKCDPVLQMFLVQGCCLRNLYIYMFLVSPKPSTCPSNRKLFQYIRLAPISVAARSKTWVLAVGLIRLRFQIPPGGHGCLSFAIVVRCEVEVSATGRSLVQKSRNESCVPECDRDALTTRRP